MNITLDIMDEMNWVMRNDVRKMQVMAFGETYNHKEFVLTRTGDEVMDTRGIAMYMVSEGNKLSNYPVFATKYSPIDTFIKRYSEYVEMVPELEPISTVYMKNAIYTRFYKTDGNIRPITFDGTLDDLKDLLGDTWEVLDRHTKLKQISYIAETELGEYVGVIIREDVGYTPIIITPCTFTTGGVIWGNYGTPTVGADIVSAVTRFNKDVFDSQKFGCKWGQIVRLYSNDGVEMGFPLIEE